MIKIFTICLIIICCGVMSVAQSSVTTAFTAKDYAKYLTFVAQELTAPQAATYQFVGIALARTDGWDAETGKLAREKLKTNKDGLRQLEAAYWLARGDLRGMKILFLDGAPPGTPAGFTSVTQFYREHGCETAASACDVIYSTTQSGNGIGTVKDGAKARAGVQAWRNIPAEQLVPLTQVLEGRFANNPLRLIEMIEGSESIATDSKAGQVSEGIGYARGELYFLQKKRAIDMARRVAIHGNTPGEEDAAMGMAKAAYLRDTTNPWMLTRSLSVLLEVAQHVEKVVDSGIYTKNDDVYRLMYIDRKDLAYSDGLKFCQMALKAVPEPGLRDARITYLTYLRTIAGKNIPGAVDPLTYQTNADNLFSADALLVDGKLPEAAAKYTAILNDAKQPLANRLDAWAGLLESDPAAALPAGGALVTEISKLDAATRTPLLQWFAWHLWQAAGSEVSLPKDEYPKPYGAPYRLTYPAQYQTAKVSAVKDGYTQVATLIDQCLAIDSIALLKQDPSREWMDLRLGLSMLYLLAGQPEKGGKLALQRIEETLPAPPWGWRSKINGMPETNANKPKLFSYPDDNETLALIPDLIIAVNGSHIDVHQGCDFYGYLAPVLFKRYKKAISISDMGDNYFAPVTAIVNGAVTLLERDAPPTGKETKDLDILTRALKEFMNDKSTSYLAASISDDTIFPALLSAKTVAVRNLLCDLIETAYQIYGKVASSPSEVGIYIKNMAARIEYKRDDLKPYAQRLREKFPLTVPPVPPAK